MKAKVDRETCIGCGMCASTCPDVFSMDDEDKAVAINADIPENSLDTAKEAEQDCPVTAIKIN